MWRTYRRSEQACASRVVGVKNNIPREIHEIYSPKPQIISGYDVIALVLEHCNVA